MARAQKNKRGISEAALALIADHGWRDFSMTALAEAAGMETSALLAEVPDRRALLRRIGRELDDSMTPSKAADLADMTRRERLFELMMRRFEAMRPWRAGLARLATDARRAPELLLAGACNLDRMADRLLDLADIRFAGCARHLARRGLMAIYARCFAVWLEDDSEDLAKTMAELDKQLGRLERIASLTCKLGRRRPRGPAPAAPAAAT